MYTASNERPTHSFAGGFGVNDSRHWVQFWDSDTVCPFIYRRRSNSRPQTASADQAPIKTVPANCWTILLDKWNVTELRLSANYDPTAHRWDLEPNGIMQMNSWFSANFGDDRADKIYLESGDFAWSVYERTSVVVATGSDEINQLC